MDEDYFEGDHQLEQQRDHEVDEVKLELMATLFDIAPQDVFYERQIQVLYEDKFFHWITGKALHELPDERSIKTMKLQLGEHTEIRIYCSVLNRYWKRQAEGIRKLVLRFSTPEFGRALGHHAETMFDAALPTAGFLPKAKNLREYNGHKWTESQHDLDRVFERDAISYGTEIKNTLDYIPRDELEIKLRMCKELQLRPLFILRYAPKTYINMVINAGGYALIFKWQLYPFGTREFAREVRSRLGLPVDSPIAIADGTVKRFLNWHVNSLNQL
jgi:hypothetical protein